MASRKEEREALRQRRLEKEAAAKGSDRKRLTMAYVAGAGVVAVVAVVIILLASGGSSGSGGGGEAHINLNASYGSTNGVQPDEREGIAPPAEKVSDLETAAKKAGCVLKLNLKDEGHEHIAPGSPEPKYETNPPTSGNHVEPPYQQADGAYREMPEPIDFVHSLEHGRLEIQYDPSLPEKQQLELKGLYDTMYAASLLFPNPKIPYAVAATTWTNLLGCPTYKGSITLDAIRDFGKATWGKYGGEPVLAFKFTGPTPAEPN
ncbi:MAG: hypothetical protein QOE56_1329 [Solirubrobacterales bacterium]|jgi:hypothetical protein|nr:hypothetical protein [Solirubrobacterales bacterium]